MYKFFTILCFSSFTIISCRNSNSSLNNNISITQNQRAEEIYQKILFIIGSVFENASCNVGNTSGLSKMYLGSQNGAAKTFFANVAYSVFLPIQGYSEPQNEDGILSNFTMAQGTIYNTKTLVADWNPKGSGSGKFTLKLIKNKAGDVVLLISIKGNSWEYYDNVVLNDKMMKRIVELLEGDIKLIPTSTNQVSAQVSNDAMNTQLPVVYSSGGEKIINWVKEKKRASSDGVENPFLYGSGCTDSPRKASASSTLASQGASNYNANNLFDWDPQTPWVEGKSDYGVGEQFQVDLPYGGSNVGIFNGYQKSYETWVNNSRVKKFKVYGDGKPLCYLFLQDLMGCQTFDIPDNNDYNLYTFEIVEVYPGEKWKDVAISEICSLGCCFNVNTLIQSNGEQLISGKLKKGSFISTLDIESQKISENKILDIIERSHSKMIRVTTKNHSVEITPYHPLFVKDIGFTSLLKLKKEQNLNDYEELSKNLSVLVWNENERILTYEKIDRIELLIGTFSTFSILNVENANTFIMNGFVSTPYVK